jgi:hypothetical protein
MVNWMGKYVKNAKPRDRTAINSVETQDDRNVKNPIYLP